MHNAPSVTYPVGRSRLAGALLAAAWLAGAAATAGWAWQDAGPAGRHAFAAALLVLTGIAAATAWWRSPAGVLNWDGVGWRWEEAAGAASGLADVACALDLQVALLLRAGGGAGTRWLWAQRSQSPVRWQDLRRAVYSRARPDALGGATTPPANP